VNLTDFDGQNALNTLQIRPHGGLNWQLAFVFFAYTKRWFPIAYS
jgi:hypothetical protein